MNNKSLELLEKYVPKNYIAQSNQAKMSHEHEIRILLEKSKIPETGWPHERVEMFLNHLSLMDTNNYQDSCGLGEREGRVFSGLVGKRHYHFSHGIGRSGDLAEMQPKAIGSSVVNKLTNELVLDLLKISGMTLVQDCLIVPMATGMTLAFCMMSIRLEKPNARYVLMPRIDQKSCIKSIITAGFTPIIIENILNGDELSTDLSMIEIRINDLGADNIACVLSTTSCFAPRIPDKVEEIAAICKKYSVFHLINNAYGVQSSKITHSINQSCRTGRVDLIVQSTDKNLMVPVGGAIVCSPNEAILKRLAQFYPGRASISQTLDVLITLLSMGSNTYRDLLAQRKECFKYLKTQLAEIANKYGEKVLDTPRNPISLGLTLRTFGPDYRELTKIGSMLFVRYVSGVRVVTPGQCKELGGYMFNHFGSHSNQSQTSYLTAAAAIGLNKSEVDLFLKRLDKVLESARAEKSVN